MKNGIRTLLITVSLVLFSLVFLTQCDLIIGSGDRTGNVGIDLSGFFGEGRAIGLPVGIEITSIKVTVFGPGMERIEKTVSAGTRYINMYVPAGQNRYFTLEIFIDITAPGSFPYENVRSFKGRAIADLRPGYFVGLKFRMGAGATQLLVPDYGNNLIFQSENMNFSPYQSDTFKLSLYPYDIDIDADGRVFAANYFDGFSAGYGIQLNGYGQGIINGLNMTRALAMDRDANFDVDRDGLPILDKSVLYFSANGTIMFTVVDSLPAYTTHYCDSTGMSLIRGMTVDPWTHRLYLVGQTSGGQEAIVEYDTFYAINIPGAGWQYGQVIRTVTNPLFETINDIIVKDEDIFVLNELKITTPPADQPPVILQFDKNLNYVKGFGVLSYDPSKQMLESVAPGYFYHPKRFFAHENEGLYILDDSNQAFDKLVYINTALDPSSWKTFPASGADIFSFMETFP